MSIILSFVIDELSRQSYLIATPLMKVNFPIKCKKEDTD